ncbi:MAG: hypothetical protein K6F52_05935, partial [Clostridia bacterium]|nr:hypothetical protein [Clostridia bacterium]
MANQWQNLSSQDYAKKLKESHVSHAMKQVMAGKKQSEKFTYEQRVAMGQRYHHSLRSAKSQYEKFNTVIGLHASTEDYSFEGDLTKLRIDTEAYEENALYLTKESEKGEKTSTQEERAMKRMGPGEMVIDKTKTEEARARYLQAKQEHKAPANMKLSGEEFETTRPKQKGMDPEELSQLMLKRDIVESTVKTNREKKEPSFKDRASAEFYEELLASMDDVIATYFKASGVDHQSGQPVSGKELEKAKHHLALAMENYHNLAKNSEKIIARNLFDIVRKTPEYKAKFEETRRTTEANAFASLHQKINLTGNALNDIKALLESLDDYKDKYLANRDLIDRIIRDYTQTNVTATEISNIISTLYRVTTEDMHKPLGLEQEKLAIMLGMKESRFQADAAAAAIDFLLKDRICVQPEMIVFVKKTWGLDIGPVPIERKVADDIYPQMRQEYEQALEKARQRKAEDEAARDALLASAEYQQYQQRKAAAGDNPEAVKAVEAEFEDLLLRVLIAEKQVERSGDKIGNLEAGLNQDILPLGRILGDLSKETEYSRSIVQFGDKVYKTRTTGPGTRDIVRLFEPLSGLDTTKTPEYYTALLNSFTVTKDGTEFFGDGTKFSEEQRVQRAATLIEPMKSAQADLKGFVDGHPELFGPGDVKDLMTRVPKLFDVFKKGQALRDVCQGFATVYPLMTAEQQETIRKCNSFGSALFDYIQDLQLTLTQITDAGKTYEDWFSDPESAYKYKNFAEALTYHTADKEKLYSGIMAKHQKKMRDKEIATPTDHTVKPTDMSPPPSDPVEPAPRGPVGQ